jgi:hypothetical protein
MENLLLYWEPVIEWKLCNYILNLISLQEQLVYQKL